MKSFCIKTNNNDILNYLLERIQAIDFENLVYSQNQYRVYQNIVIHYLGKENEKFYTFLCELLEEIVIEFYQEKMIKQLINYNYFYFDDYEKTKIEENCLQMVETKEYQEKIKKDKLIQKEILMYCIENKAMILDGFVYFRLQNYFKLIDEIVDSRSKSICN